jgi:hypothetical protein
MPTASHTLLIITNSQMARIDFFGRRRVRVGKIRVENKPNNGLASSVSEALALIPNRPGLVSILTSLVWSEVLYLQKDVVSIASTRERQQALAIDAEAESGISPFESQVVSVQLGTKERDAVPFCVTQVANTQIDELAQLLRFHKSRLFCIAHPIAIDLANCQSACSEEIDRLLQRWNDDSPTGMASDFTATEVAHAADIWANLIGRRTGQAEHRSTDPLWIKPLEPTVDHRQVVALSASLAVLVIFGCTQFNAHTRSYLNSIKQSIVKIERQQSERSNNLDAIKKTELRLNQLRKDALEAEAIRETSERQVRLAATHQARRSIRWSGLLDGLAESAEDCWVKEIKFDSGRTIVHGFAPGNASAHSFAGRVERRLQETGWVVSPAATALSDNGLVEFFVTLAADKADPQLNELGNQLITQSTPDVKVDLANIGPRGIQP